MSPQVALRRAVFAVFALLLALGATTTGQARVTPTASGTPPASVSSPHANTGFSPQSFMVTTTDDTPTDNNCTQDSCTLRQAVSASNSNDPGTGNQNTITFASGLAGPIALMSGEGHGTLTFYSSVTITGPTSGAGIIVDGNHATSVFTVCGCVTASISNLTITNGNAGDSGGGILNDGTLALTNVTFSGNGAGNGGGGIANSGGTLTITNSTFFSNSAPNGGGIFNNTGTLSLTNSTIAGNTSSNGGGIATIGTLNLTNTIVAGNTAPLGPDILGTVTTDNHDLIGGTPLLATLAYNSGTTQTMALLPGSQAIGGGTTVGADIPTTDQRGIARTGHNDIGAFQSRGFILARSSGDGQSVTVNMTFAPLVVTVGSTNGEPVDGGIVTFTGPSSGADITPDPQTATIGATTTRQASITPTANGIAGNHYTVTAAVATGTTPASVPFTLSNVGLTPQSYIVTTTDDTPTDANCTGSHCTLRQAVNASNSNNPGAGNHNTISFKSGVAGTITLVNDGGHGTLILTNDVTITGPTSGAGVTVSGGRAVRVLVVCSCATASISNLTIADGDVTGDGGGIVNVGTLAVTNMLFSANGAVSTNTNGGAIYNMGTLTVADSTFVSNSAHTGGGIASVGGTVSVTNSTFTGNSATNGAAIYNGGVMTVINSTLTANSGGTGGGVNNFRTLKLQNTLIAGNTATNSGPEVNGAIISLGYNLLGTISGATGITNGMNGDIVNPIPLLGTLGNYDGPTQTIPLLPGSPAISGGTTSGAPATDQRGIARTGHNDIGAFQSQGFTLAKTSGDGQTVPLGATAAPLVVSVASSHREPVDGGIVTFTGPSSGAGIVTTPVSISITGGQASITPTANHSVGSYTVAASVATGTTPAVVSFSLTNTAVSLSSITLTGPNGESGSVAVKIGQGVQLSAIGHYSDGSTVKLTNQVHWMAAPNQQIAAVDGTGKVTGESGGTTTITATLGGVSGTMTVTVGRATPIGIPVPPLPPGRTGAPPPVGPPPAPLPPGR